MVENGVRLEIFGAQDAYEAPAIRVLNSALETTIYYPPSVSMAAFNLDDEDELQELTGRERCIGSDEWRTYEGYFIQSSVRDYTVCDFNELWANYVYFSPKD